MYINGKKYENVLMAPIYGYTDVGFRMMCNRLGADVTFTGYFKNINEINPMAFSSKEKHVVAQLIGNDSLSLCRMAAKIEELGLCEWIDINFSCPYIDSDMNGAIVTSDFFLLEKIIKSIVRSVDLPVTVKIRKGLNDKKINAVEVVKLAESCGVKAVSIHARTAEQKYNGNADWLIIKKIKEISGIPIIGNGDVKSAEDALEMVKLTNCDGVMIGRAALSNPQLIYQSISLLNNYKNKYKQLTAIELIKLFLECELIYNKNIQIEVVDKVLGSILIYHKKIRLLNILRKIKSVEKRLEYINSVIDCL